MTTHVESWPWLLRRTVIYCCLALLRCMAAAYTTNLSELLYAARHQHDDIIYGNPLLTAECATALLDEHQYNVNLLQQSGFPSPWFWSRESLDATLAGITLHRRTKVTHARTPDPPFYAPWSNFITNDYATDRKNMSKHIAQWYSQHIKDHITAQGNTYQDDYVSLALEKSRRPQQQRMSNNVFYYHIEKAGSSTVGTVLGGLKFNRSFVSENWITSTTCGFTFVREPIDRFISGYYTVNRLIYDRNIPGKYIITYPHPQKYEWYNISGEPQRFTQFVDDLMKHRFEFINTTPLEHMMSQTGILSVAQHDIHFVGRLDKLKTHWNELRRAPFCANDKLRAFEWTGNERKSMVSYGSEGLHDEIHAQYLQMMDLVGHHKGDLLPAYKAIADNYDLYAKIVHYLRQDYVCLGFEHDFHKFRQRVYDKLPAE